MQINKKEVGVTVADIEEDDVIADFAHRCVRLESEMRFLLTREPSAIVGVAVMCKSLVEYALVQENVTKSLDQIKKGIDLMYSDYVHDQDKEVIECLKAKIQKGE